MTFNMGTPKRWKGDEKEQSTRQQRKFRRKATIRERDIFLRGAGAGVSNGRKRKKMKRKNRKRGRRRIGGQMRAFTIAKNSSIVAIMAFKILTS